MGDNSVFVLYSIDWSGLIGVGGFKTVYLYIRSFDVDSCFLYNLFLYLVVLVYFYFLVVYVEYFIKGKNGNFKIC